MPEWTRLPGSGLADVLLLLTDGSVLCRASSWRRFRPDVHGGYAAGTWSDVPPPPHTVVTYADAAVLADGRVAWLHDYGLDLYDPIGNNWNTASEFISPYLETPGVWLRPPMIALDDGRLLITTQRDDWATATSIGYGSVIYDPSGSPGGRWYAAEDRQPDCIDPRFGTGEPYRVLPFTLMPSGEVLTSGCGAGGTGEIIQTFRPTSGSWGVVQPLPNNLLFQPQLLTLLIPSGSLVSTSFWGGRADPLGGDLGGWQIPRDYGSDLSFTSVRGDAACLLPNGRILIFGVYRQPTEIYDVTVVALECDMADGSVILSGLPSFAFRPSYISSRPKALVLPSGQVFISGIYVNDTVGQPSSFFLYTTTDSGIRNEWRPRLHDWPASVHAGRSYPLQGAQLNGLSHAHSSVWSSQSATNYPIVELRYPALDRGRWYCRTHDHSSMGVATGDRLVSTTFDVPLGAPSGPAEIRVIANGIPSLWEQISVTNELPVDQYPQLWTRIHNLLIGSLADGPLIVVGPDGVPRPIGPWDPLIRDARAAYEQIRAGVEALDKLGAELAQKEQRIRPK